VSNKQRRDKKTTHLSWWHLLLLLERLLVGKLQLPLQPHVVELHRTGTSKHGHVIVSRHGKLLLLLLLLRIQQTSSSSGMGIAIVTMESHRRLLLLLLLRRSRQKTSRLTIAAKVWRRKGKWTRTKSMGHHHVYHQKVRMQGHKKLIMECERSEHTSASAAYFNAHSKTKKAYARNKRTYLESNSALQSVFLGWRFRPLYRLRKKLGKKRTQRKS
jgi:hypothetical protein